MEPRRSVPRMYGRPSPQDPLDWKWVAGKLTSAGLYWVDARPEGHPHPRPVWGLWLDNELQLSIGSPAIRQSLANDPRVTVHLESATDVVLVEGHFAAGAKTEKAALEAYNGKYDWVYDLDLYGPFSRVIPEKVLAWRTAGFAGRESFQTTGSWTFA